MQIFAITDIKDRELVLRCVQENYDGKYFDPGRNTMFVATEGETSKEVAAKVGVSSANTSGFTSGVVFPVESYWGHYDPLLWEWLRAKASSDGF